MSNYLVANERRRSYARQITKGDRLTLTRTLYTPRGKFTSGTLVVAESDSHARGMEGMMVLVWPVGGGAGTLLVSAGILAPVK